MNEKTINLDAISTQDALKYATSQFGNDKKNLLKVLGNINNHELHGGNPLLLEQIAKTLLELKGELSAKRFLASQILKHLHATEDIKIIIKNYQFDTAEIIKISQQLEPENKDPISTKERKILSLQRFSLQKAVNLLNAGYIQECMDYIGEHIETCRHEKTYLPVLLWSYNNKSSNVVSKRVKEYLFKEYERFTSIIDMGPIIVQVIKNNDTILFSLLKKKLAQIIEDGNNPIEDLFQVCIFLSQSRSPSHFVDQLFDMYKVQGGVCDRGEIKKAAQQNKESFNHNRKNILVPEIRLSIDKLDEIVAKEPISKIYVLFFQIKTYAGELFDDPKERVPILQKILDITPSKHKHSKEYAEMHYSFHYDLKKGDIDKMSKSLNLLYEYNKELFDKLFDGTLLPWIRYNQKNQPERSIGQYRLNTGIYAQIALHQRLPINKQAALLIAKKVK